VYESEWYSLSFGYVVEDLGYILSFFSSLLFLFLERWVLLTLGLVSIFLSLFIF
jgi:hypothetical protein